ncbi:MAG TPA: serine/threonine-protein kinase, partial [Polyangiales bacterium]
MNAVRPPLEDADHRPPPHETALRHVAQQAPQLTPGEVIAERFRVERLAGTGGMGAVYRAHDLYSGEVVALKIVAGARSVRAQRFAREAQLLSQVVHPAVVRYVAHGSAADGVPYLAMEWLDGEDLCRRLARTGLKIEELLVLMRRICSGLSLSHELGVTHRDLKPSNLFLVQGRVDAVKLIDFGIAHQAGSALTGAGSTLGTIGYMAPEQAMGAREVDARADVFALGCVMFECLTGRPAFEGPGDAAVLARVLRDEVPRVRELRQDVPESLDQLVARMLAKQPAQRPADARELLHALDAVGDLQGPALPLRTDSKSRETSEQRIASVIVARPHGPAPITLSTHQAAIEDEQWEATVRRFGARPVPLRGGQTLLVFGADEGMIASDSARQAVRCALALKSLRPHVWIGVGTGSLATALNVSVG